MDPLSASTSSDRATPIPTTSPQITTQSGVTLSQSTISAGSKKSNGNGSAIAGTGSQISLSSTGTGVGFSSASSTSSGGSGGAIETRVSCVAIIGKQNNPIYIRTFKDERYSSMTSSPLDKLKYHYIIHTSLDAVEEKLNSGKSDQYIGFLFPTDEGKVYGYVTCTKIKFIVIIDDGAPSGNGIGGAASGGAGAGGSGAHQEIKDSTIRNLFKKIHEEYINVVSNPFHILNQKMTSKMIDRKIEIICSGI